jgi:hypothetical protein
MMLVLCGLKDFNAIGKRILVQIGLATCMYQTADKVSTPLLTAAYLDDGPTRSQDGLWQ